MKSLVTGGAGFIGSHIVDKLLEMGHEVVCYDNESAESNEDFYRNPKAYNIKGDIRDYQLLKNSMTGVDYVFHLAAESRIQPAILNPIEAVSVNCVGTVTVLQCAREVGVKKVIYSSTSSGYGFNEPPNDELQNDDCLNPYSVSKVAGEKLCKMYNDLWGLKTVFLRYFNVYGERQPLKGQYAPVIGIFLRQRDSEEALTIVGDGEQRRDFTHVSDVVQANILAATNEVHDMNYGQLYNVGNGVNYSINEIANVISDNQVNIPSRIGESRITLAKNDKLKRTFGWEPKVNLMDWISEQ
ncbi:nucleotide-sugar epimerase [Synechococcus phage S-SKS1]|uniref:Nucleotide-sugar epimerase n=1 Tax=Synechococcus phage S-SKS1 TaxID=754042 RepID=M4QPK0_9CAUD|nr:nucleotide-sugar epimerase [Synechococcus phage S-SKS1]AGH31550.1 nucleotide-sugar epimerase [Synechococcus phage S-SKS1]